MAVEKKAVQKVAAETEQEVNEMIDGLEQPAASDADAANEPQDIEDFHASTGDESMEETLGTLKGDEPTDESPLAGDADPASETDEDSGTESAPENGELTLSLTGNMTLRLKYQYEGNDVMIGFKDHALQVRMSDGTEFKIPVRRRHLKLVS